MQEEYQSSRGYWEDFLQFCQDKKELDNRLGFNLFGTDYGKLYPNYDADPISIKSKDKENNFHNVAEVAEKYYDCLGLPLIFDTAGWESDDEFAKNAAIKY